ncbi:MULTISPECIES: cobalamin B12-binding domain-containing protein [Salimicrobium]|uniref:Methanogenic corrinoid protein MtbC1 n=2 Tax=Salimicrobium TaxID=351195 RepID=A0ABY1KSD5_9BACI|nr:MULTISPECIES: cobalamin-dependent protein [Salimicrobium]SDX99956.1 Methanogenic corrinoid protein MtbC1 [Salimicrobium album]SIS71414.1 Methanogenic corrinoid protein MtbC1 [Salimicrobium salexigens]
MEEVYKQLTGYLLEGEEQEALQLVRKWVDERSLLEVHEEIITPAMYYVGELWQTNRISVADEHLATATCDYIMTLISPRKGASNGKKAIFFNVEEEEHHLGLKMAADIFREEGWESRFLGTGVPDDHVLQQIEKFRPDVICISAALSYRVPEMHNIIDILKKRMPDSVILIGGRIVKNHGMSEWNVKRVHTMSSLTAVREWLQNGKEGRRQ